MGEAVLERRSVPMRTVLPDDRSRITSILIVVLSPVPSRSGSPDKSPAPTLQPLDPVRLRTAFGIFPTGAVAVAAEVDGGSCLSVAAAAFGPASTVGVEFARYNCACIGTDVACVTPVSDGVHLTIRWSWHERTGGRAAAGSTGLRRLTGAG